MAENNCLLATVSSEEISGGIEHKSCKFAYTRKGSLALMVDGYAFSKVRDGKKGRAFWRCVKSKCKARLSTVDNVIQCNSYRNEHMHPTEAEEQQVCVCVCLRGCFQHWSV